MKEKVDTVTSVCGYTAEMTDAIMPNVAGSVSSWARWFEVSSTYSLQHHAEPKKDQRQSLR